MVVFLNLKYEEWNVFLVCEQACFQCSCYDIETRVNSVAPNQKTKIRTATKVEAEQFFR